MVACEQAHIWEHTRERQRANTQKVSKAKRKKVITSLLASSPDSSVKVPARRLRPRRLRKQSTGADLGKIMY